MHDKYLKHTVFAEINAPRAQFFEAIKKISNPISFVYPPPPLKNHPSKPISFVYPPLWKITHQKPSVLCTPPFEKSLFLVGAYFGVGVYFGKYGIQNDEKMFYKIIKGDTIGTPYTQS